jgi:hypothetical protein
MVLASHGPNWPLAGLGIPWLCCTWHGLGMLWFSHDRAGHWLCDLWAGLAMDYSIHRLVHGLRCPWFGQGIIFTGLGMGWTDHGAGRSWSGLAMYLAGHGLSCLWSGLARPMVVQVVDWAGHGQCCPWFLRSLGCVGHGLGWPCMWPDKTMACPAKS